MFMFPGSSLGTHRSVLVLLFLVFSVSSAFGSTIAGFVYDKQRNALALVDLELLDDYYRQVNRTQSDGSGRYQFNGLPDGHYTVRVMPFRLGYEDQSQTTSIDTITVRGAGTGSAYIQLDFYLVPKKGGLAETELGVVFSQDVPDPAKKLYEKAVADLSHKRVKEGVDGLYGAIKVFPDYFNAIYRVGKELVALGEFDEAWPYFARATEINPKSGSSFYYLGLSLNKLGDQYNKAATMALKQAHLLAPASEQVLYLLGKIQRSTGDLEGAEANLVKAKKLSRDSVPEIHKELAQLYANDLKKYAEAADELELYLKSSKLQGADAETIKKKAKELRSKAQTQSKKS